VELKTSVHHALVHFLPTIKDNVSSVMLNVLVATATVLVSPALHPSTLFQLAMVHAFHVKIPIVWVAIPTPWLTVWVVPLATHLTVDNAQRFVLNLLVYNVHQAIMMLVLNVDLDTSSTFRRLSVRFALVLLNAQFASLQILQFVQLVKLDSIWQLMEHAWLVFLSARVAPTVLHVMVLLHQTARLL